MIDFLLMNLLCMLPGMFAALLWLKPGKREAVRYAMILLSYGGLLCLLDISADKGGAGAIALLHLCFSGALLVFLLGRYMLKCGWKQALYAIGIYQLVWGICCMPVVPCFQEMSGSSWISLLGASAGVLYVWFFVWLAARKYAISWKEGLLTSAAIVACESFIAVNLGCYVSRLFPIEGYRMAAAYMLFPLACSLLCFALVMRFVHGLSWKRSFAFALLYMALPLLSVVGFILMLSC